ncbi:hypothetical protein Tco_0471477 [Tanacetum coccineum]
MGSAGLPIGGRVMVRLNSFARLISDAERQRVNQEKELKYASTLLQPHTIIEHIQLIDFEVQDATAELDRLATISKDMVLNEKEQFNKVRQESIERCTHSLCEPTVGLLVVSDNVPTENESTSNIVAGSSVIVS